MNSVKSNQKKRDVISVWFGRFAMHSAAWVGSAWAFVLALLSIGAWIVSGPYYHYSDTWQLVVNTATTVITFLIVFLIQNTQNRDARALHLKLDEIIRSSGRAHNEMINIEKLSDKELEEMTHRYERLREAFEARKARAAARPLQGREITKR